MFFRIGLEDKSGDTLILRNFGKLCEITLLLYPEDLSISGVLSMLT
jgi:hypothetical protein